LQDRESYSSNGSIVQASVREEIGFICRERRKKKRSIRRLLEFVSS